MGVGLAVLTETKIVDNSHLKATTRYTIMCSKALSSNQDGRKFEVKLVRFDYSPNIVSF